MSSSMAWFKSAKSDAKYTMRTRCPQCGREHIIVFRLRHVSDSFFVQLGHFFTTRSTSTSSACAGAPTRGATRIGDANSSRLHHDVDRLSLIHCLLAVRDFIELKLKYQLATIK
jgi:hypothetical protein